MNSEPVTCVSVVSTVGCESFHSHLSHYLEVHVINPSACSLFNYNSLPANDGSDYTQ